MVDPLNPFSTVIRSLSLARKAKTSATEKTEKSHAVRPQHTPNNEVDSTQTGALRTRLRKRLRGITGREKNSEHSAFIETVLLWRLGDKLGNDPSFGEMVTNIVAQISDDDALHQELNNLIDELKV